MRFLSPVTLFVLILFSLPLWASPIVSVDSATFNIGTIIEGSVKKISHQYVLSNTGNKPLVIKDVRPGCGCTVVRFDTSIAAGKTGKVFGDVDISRVQPGTFSKRIIVFSNAENKPELELNISGTIRPVTELEPQYLTMEKNQEGLNQASFTIAVANPALKISKIIFAPRSESTSHWQTPLPVFLDFSFSRSDIPDPDSFYKYTVKMSYNYGGEQNRPGEFVLITNDPAQPEIKQLGIMQAETKK